MISTGHSYHRPGTCAQLMQSAFPPSPQLPAMLYAQLQGPLHDKLSAAAEKAQAGLALALALLFWAIISVDSL